MVKCMQELLKTVLSVSPRVWRAEYTKKIKMRGDKTRPVDELARGYYRGNNNATRNSRTVLVTYSSKTTLNSSEGT